MIGEQVQILTPSKQTDPNLYEVVKNSGVVVHLKIVGENESDRTFKVHKTRIVNVMDTTTADNEVTATPSASTNKKTPYDFASKMEEMGAGSVHYRKPMPNFANAEAFSHVIVNGSRTQFFTINTYNGSSGKNGKADGKYYAIKEGKWDSKLNRMTKDGYVEVTD